MTVENVGIVEIAGILLAILSLVSVGLYKIIIGSVEKKVNKYTKDMLNLTEGQSHNHIGLTYWNEYVKFKNPSSIEDALMYTEQALKKTERIKDNFEGKELALCHIKNNYAYYLAEKVRTSGANAQNADKALANAFIEYLSKRIHIYREFRHDWTDTCEFVKKHC